MIQTATYMLKPHFSHSLYLPEFHETDPFQETLSKSPKNINQKNSKIKSSLCKNYMEEGVCLYGDKCQFAHGTEELKCNSENQVCYKTKPCYSFSRRDTSLTGRGATSSTKTNRQMRESMLDTGKLFTACEDN